MTNLNNQFGLGVNLDSTQNSETVRNCPRMRLSRQTSHAQACMTELDKIWKNQNALCYAIVKAHAEAI